MILRSYVVGRDVESRSKIKNWSIMWWSDYLRWFMALSVILSCDFVDKYANQLIIDANYLNCVVHDMNSIWIEIRLSFLFFLDVWIIDSSSFTICDDDHLSVTWFGISEIWDTRPLRREFNWWISTRRAHFSHKTAKRTIHFHFDSFPEEIVWNKITSSERRVEHFSAADASINWLLANKEIVLLKDNDNFSHVFQNSRKGHWTDVCVTLNSETSSCGTVRHTTSVCVPNPDNGHTRNFDHQHKALIWHRAKSISCQSRRVDFVNPDQHSCAFVVIMDMSVLDLGVEWFVFTLSHEDHTEVHVTCLIQSKR